MNDPRSRDDDSERELKDAGYTSARGALAFCFIAAIVGGALGSVYLAIAFNVLFGPERAALNEVAGSIAGALAAVGLMLSKIWQGNLEARETVEQAAWRRLVHEVRRSQRGGLL